MDRHGTALSARSLSWAAVVPTVFLAWFFLYPVGRILWISLSGGGNPIDLLTSVGLWDVVAFTVGQALASTMLTLLIGLPVAGVFARFQFRFKRTLKALITIPFVLPTVVVASAFLSLVGPRGVVGVNLEGTLALILIAHVFYNVAVVVRVVGALWETVDPRMEEAATMLGASRFTAFRSVTLPLLRPGLLAAASLVFLFTFTSFGVVLILGGLAFETLEVAIYNRAIQAFDLQGAALLSLVQLLGVGLTLGWYAHYQRSHAVQRSLSAPVQAAKPPTGLREQLWVRLTLGLIVAFTVTPLLMLVARSLRAGGEYSLTFYRRLAERDTAFAVPPAEAIGNSMRFAFAAAVIAVVVGGLAAAVVAYGRGPSSRWFDAVLMLPLGTSAVTVGFGFLVALDRPIDLRASIWIIPIAHALVAVPFVVRSAVPVMMTVQHRLREAAAMLGASPLRAFREIDLPLVARALMVGAAFAFAISLGEFGATAFIVRPDNPTLPIAIERFLSRPGEVNFGQAMAMASILMVITAVSIGLIDHRRGRGGF